MPNELILRVMRAMDGETFFAFRNASKHINNLFLLEEEDDDESGGDNMELVTHTLRAWLETFLTEEEIGRGFVGRDVLRVGVNSLSNLPHFNPYGGVDAETETMTFEDFFGIGADSLSVERGEEDDDDGEFCREVGDEISMRIKYLPALDEQLWGLRDDGWPKYKEPTKNTVSTKCQKELLARMRIMAVNIPSVPNQHTVLDLIRIGTRDGFGVKIDNAFYNLWRELQRMHEASLSLTNGVHTPESLALLENSKDVKTIAVLVRETQNVPLLAITLLTSYDDNNMRKMSGESERLRYLVQRHAHGGIKEIANHELVTRYHNLGYFDNWMTSRKSPWSGRSENDANRALQELNALRIAFELNYRDGFPSNSRTDGIEAVSDFKYVFIDSIGKTPETIGFFSEEEIHKESVRQGTILQKKFLEASESRHRDYHNPSALYTRWTSKKGRIGGLVSYNSKYALIVMSIMRFLPREYFIELTDILERQLTRYASSFESSFRQAKRQSNAVLFSPTGEVKKFFRYARKLYGLSPSSARAIRF